MPRDFFDPNEPVDKHPGNLPHWMQDEVMQFVTFRLGDSIPAGELRLWREEREAFLSQFPVPWSSKTEEEYYERFPGKLEYWLDQGAGACLLRDPGNRKIIEEVVMHGRGITAEHHAWVFMPNHVHLLFKPLVPLEKLVQAWKSVSARRIAKGGIWQSNYRDTLIRHDEHFANAVRYIRKNPEQGKLREGEFSLWESERAKAVK